MDFATTETYRSLAPRRVRKLIRFMEGELDLNPSDRYRAYLLRHLEEARAALALPR